MASIEEKYRLILEASKVATEMETRGRLMQEHQPQIAVVTDQDSDGTVNTQILLKFPNGQDTPASNWSGMGKSLEQAFEANLLCLMFELQERQQLIQKTLEKLIPVVQEAYPEDERVAKAE